MCLIITKHRDLTPMNMSKIFSESREDNLFSIFSAEVLADLSLKISSFSLLICNFCERPKLVWCQERFIRKQHETESFDLSKAEEIFRRERLFQQLTQAEIHCFRIAAQPLRQVALQLITSLPTGQAPELTRACKQ